ncbi:hypothetical protein GQ55_6G289900 [Panicum hallii var. hallii]|uniref:Uncharacterized protein n=1 Tax=Panicum hallii var. hallii TaxID=1504633 RepID=A0A2T7DAU5_9POAL|nr:hypothetical protein GQ55_6G289900 [Panicum hallii var. hallii]
MARRFLFQKLSSRMSRSSEPVTRLASVWEGASGSIIMYLQRTIPGWLPITLGFMAMKAALEPSITF